jgi:hypothetical protein
MVAPSGVDNYFIEFLEIPAGVIDRSVLKAIRFQRNDSFTVRASD